MENSKLAIKLYSAYSVLFLGVACTNPFLTLYFQERGLNYTEIGIAFAFFYVAGVVTQPVWGFITDKYSNKRDILIIMSLLNSLIIFNFIFANNFYYVVLCAILLAIFQNSLAPIADAYSYGIIEHYRDIQYGKVRLTGSFGYAVGALILGWIIKNFGINSSFYIYFLVMLIAALLLYNIKFRDKAVQKKVNIQDIAKLLKDKRFAILTASVIIANIPMGSNASYITVLIQKTGGDVSQVGLMWFIIAISELPVFYYGTRFIKKYGELNLYVLAMILFSIRFYLDSICTSFTSVLIIQLMQSITFTFYLISVLHYLNEITSSEVKTTAMTFYAASCGLGALIGNIGGGILLDHFSIFALYRIISIICLISLCLVLALKKYEQINVEGIENS